MAQSKIELIIELKNRVNAAQKPPFFFLAFSKRYKSNIEQLITVKNPSLTCFFPFSFLNSRCF